MISPIKAQEKVKVDPKTVVTKEKFNVIVEDVYDIMLNYSRITGKGLNKTHPMLIGNVLFWFETDTKTDQSYLKFDQDVTAWNVETITVDIQMHIHDLYYNGGVNK